MNCVVIEEEDDLNLFTSNSPYHRKQIKREHSLHSPLSSNTVSTASSVLSIDSNHHSSTDSNSPPCEYSVKDLEAQSGLNLLVAALDVQNLQVFKRDQFVDEDSSSHHHTSDEETPSEKRKIRRKSTVPVDCKDDTYWEKRRRNNEAAKRSREKRRSNDMAMEARLMELSRENSLLKHELDSVKKRQPTPSPAHMTMPSSGTPEMPPMVSSTPPDIAAQFGALSSQSSFANSAAAAAHFASLTAPRPQFLNPLLAAMVPQAMLLQAITQQRPHATLPLAVNGKQYNPYSAIDGPNLQLHQNQQLGADQQQHRQHMPSALSVALSAPASPGPPTASSFSDGKQYLRYKLLERQLQQQNNHSGISPSHGLNLLGSVISATPTSSSSTGMKPPAQRSASTVNNCGPPAAKRQRTTTASKSAISDLIKTDADTSLSLKECLSSLAVSLISPNPASMAVNTEKAAIGCDSSSTPNGLIRSRASPGSQQQSVIFEDGINQIGDLLRARTHSDSSQSSAGISSHGSTTSTCISASGLSGAISPSMMMELEFRNSLAERRRDSNNSDSGIVSDGTDAAIGDRRASTGSCTSKRYRSDHERYMERRRRNNEAAKRCRANRRAMFEYRYQRAQELENENSRLKDEMRQLSRELSELKEMLSKRDGFILPREMLLESVLMHKNELDENQGDDDHHSMDDDIKEPVLTIDTDESNARDETPLDFTVKK